MNAPTSDVVSNVNSGVNTQTGEPIRRGRDLLRLWVAGQTDGTNLGSVHDFNPILLRPAVPSQAAALPALGNRATAVPRTH